jgi:hypothetical protein
VVTTMTYCKICLLPAQAINCDLDSNSICRLCKTYKKHEKQLTDFDRGQALLKERVNRIKGHQKYDCLIGLSGGKDSSYVAYKMCREYGLKALLFTYNNGFLNEYAHHNIALVAKELGQDHIYCEITPQMSKAIYRASVLRYGVPCIGCAFPGITAMFKTAIDQNIPLIVHGRSRPQMFRELTEGNVDPFIKLHYGNFKSYDRQENKNTIAKYLKKINRWMKRLISDSELKEELHATFLPDLNKLHKMQDAPEATGLFIYEPYDEQNLKKTLQEELGWRAPPDNIILSHHDCEIHDAAAHLYNKVHNYSMLHQETSVMVREGTLSVSEANDLLQARGKSDKSYTEEGMLALEQLTGLSQKKILASAAKTAKKIALLKTLLKMKYQIVKRKELPI